MLKQTELETLVTHGESETLEFKKSTAQLFSAFETICAFLNGKGGTVLIGVTNNQKIIGQHVSDNTQQELANEINKIEPHPDIDIQYIPNGDDKQVIVVGVQPGAHAPYIYHGKPFQRNQSTTTQMSQHRYEQLLVERGQLNHSWEELTATDYDINSLDHTEIRLAVKQGITAGRIPIEAENSAVEVILASWNLIKEGKINNAAAVLFAREVLPRYQQCHLKLGRFRGTEITGDLIDNKEFFGNAFRMLSEANQFITRHLPIASFFEIDRFERIDRPALPVLAVREALVNAICHRDYSNRSTSITLAIFDDRMEIWNTGKLPSELKLDDLKKKHKSVPRNKIISKVFYDRKFFDGWGTGTVKIFDLCRDNNVPEPQYTEYSGGVEVTFKFKEPIGITLKPVAAKQQLSVRQEEILSIIKKYASISLKQLAEKLENPPSERMIRNDLNSLRKYGLVDIKGSARSSLWVLKKKV